MRKSLPKVVSKTLLLIYADKNQCFFFFYFLQISQKLFKTLLLFLKISRLESILNIKLGGAIILDFEFVICIHNDKY